MRSSVCEMRVVHSGRVCGPRLFSFYTQDNMFKNSLKFFHAKILAVLFFQQPYEGGNSAFLL